MEQNSSDKNPIDDFKSWAIKLGCPVKALPSDEALSRLIKSNPENVRKLMDHVRPKAEVKLIKDNLLLHSLMSNANSLSTRNQSELPNSLKNKNKAEKLNRQISELKPRVVQLSAQMNEMRSSLGKKADQLSKVKQNHRATQSKRIQLEQKHAQLLEKVAEEKKFEAMLKDAVQGAGRTNEKIEAENAIEKSLQLLRKAYDEIGDREFTKNQREKVERDIKKIMSHISVVALFEAIVRYSDNEMKAIDEQFTSITTRPSNNSHSHALDSAIAKSRMKIYVDHLKTNKLKVEHEQRVEQYVNLYDEYLARIVDQMKAFNGQEVEPYAESICSNYLKQFGTLRCNQAILQFKKQKLDNLQQLATERDALLKGHELVGAELSAMYALIEKTYNSALDDIMALGELNKNIKQLQALSKYTINSWGNKSILNRSACMLNYTLGSIVPAVAPAEYQKELAMLVGVEYEKWKKLPLPISMDIRSLHSNEVISPYYSLLTPNAALNELTLKWAWHKVIDVLTKPLDVDQMVPQFTDSALVHSNLNAETTKMSKLMEDLKFMYQPGSKTVSKIQKYLAFLLDPSLGSFIPATMLISRRNFQDYEEEFLCACSLISKSMKKK